MSVLELLLKPRKQMNKRLSREIILGDLRLSAHAQRRMNRKDGKISKIDLLKNLYGKNYVETSEKEEWIKRTSYRRISDKVTVAINKDESRIVSLWPTGSKVKKKYGMEGKKKKHANKKKRRA